MGFFQNLDQGAQGLMGKLSSALFSGTPEMMQGMDPAALQQMRQQAMLKLGLGLMAGRQQGFGRAALMGLGQAQGDFNGALQTSYQNNQRKRQEDKADTRYSETVAREDKRAADAAARDERDFKFRVQTAQQDAMQRQKALDASVGNARFQSPVERERAKMMEMERQSLEQLRSLEQKIQSGQATQEEKNAYQLLRSGRQQSADPFQMLLQQQGMGGLGNPLSPNSIRDGMAPPMSPLASEWRG